MPHSSPSCVFSSFIKIQVSRVKDAGWHSTLQTSDSGSLMLRMDFNVPHPAQVELSGKYSFSDMLCYIQVSADVYQLLTASLPDSPWLPFQNPLLLSLIWYDIFTPYLYSLNETLGEERRQQG